MNSSGSVFSSVETKYTFELDLTQLKKKNLNIEFLIVVRLRFLISILICTYGYLRVSSASLETDVLYFTFKIFSYLTMC